MQLTRQKKINAHSLVHHAYISIAWKVKTLASHFCIVRIKSTHSFVIAYMHLHPKKKLKKLFALGKWFWNDCTSLGSWRSQRDWQGKKLNGKLKLKAQSQWKQLSGYVEARHNGVWVWGFYLNNGAIMLKMVHAIMKESRAESIQWQYSLLWLTIYLHQLS